MMHRGTVNRQLSLAGCGKNSDFIHVLKGRGLKLRRKCSEISGGFSH
jgi:hypothetical protein